MLALAFVFVDCGKPTGGWLMRQSDIECLTPAQIQNKFSLEHAPNMIVDVTVPAGTPMYTGLASNVEELGTAGAGQQFLLKGDVDPTNFTKARSLQ